MVRDLVQHQIYDRSYSGIEQRFGFPDPKVTEGQDLPTNAVILSVGAGAGRDLWHLTTTARVHVFDFAASGVHAARSHDLLAVRGDAADGLPYRDAAFDLVVLKDILEHLVDPEALALEALRVLRPGGRIIVSVPNHFYLPFRIRILAGRGLIWRSVGHDHTQLFEEWNYMHLRFFTYRGFRRFLDRVGLVPERFFWDFGTLAHYNQPEMIFGAQLEKRRLGIPLSRRARLGLAVLRPAYALLNTLFPRRVRHAIVGFAPGLLCAGFYARCRAR